VNGRTRMGLRRFPALGPGSGVALIAPASPFDPDEFDRGVAEVRRLGFTPIYDASVFSRGDGIVAGDADLRARAIRDAWARDDVAALLAVRGGYGSVDVLPRLEPAALRGRPKAFIGYSDLTSMHAWLNGHVGLTSVHGAMLDGRLARGAAAYDEATWLKCLESEPLGELAPDGLEVLRPGEAAGPLVGGTLTQLAASLGTPYDFCPPDGAVLLLEDVAERPYRIRRLLTQLQLSGRLSRLAAVVCGQMPRCDEPDGRITARGVIASFFAGFSGPVLFGFPTGHSTTPFLSLPLGVHTRVVAAGAPRVVVEESAAE
jgi:muramoyltetrapeptide carboxypeptidase